MRRISVSLVLSTVVTAVALAGAALGAAASRIEGTYTETLPASEGTVVVGRHLGGKEVSGHYALAGDLITLSHESGPLSCNFQPGVYRWALRGKILTLDPAALDYCSPRHLFVSKPFRKVR